MVKSKRIHSGVTVSNQRLTEDIGHVTLVARRADPELATMLLVCGSYVFLAVLVAAVWFEPLA